MAAFFTGIRTTVLPLYSVVRAVLPEMVGMPRGAMWSLSAWLEGGEEAAVEDRDSGASGLTPDAQRLSPDEVKALAQRVEAAAHGRLDPKRLREIHPFVSTHSLMGCDREGRWRLTLAGVAFVAQDTSFTQEVDLLEGVLPLLRILNARVRSRSKELLPSWEELLESSYDWHQGTLDSLLSRLRNLIDRGFVVRQGVTYVITAQGSEYADSSVTAAAATVAPGGVPSRTLGAWVPQRMSGRAISTGDDVQGRVDPE